MQGTLIRLFDTKKKTQLCELRRGTTYSNINHLSFDYDSKFLTCSSAKSKIHVFKVPDSTQSVNPTSYFAIFSNIVSVAGSQWSYYQFVLENQDDCSESGTRAVVLGNILHVICKNKHYYRVLLNEKGGELKKDVDEFILEGL